MLKLYGVPLSQPFRSVAWMLLQKHVPFQVQLVVPGSPHKKIGSKGEDFLALTKGRSTHVPVLQDDDFVVLESPAILTYLCQSRGWTDLYPYDDLKLKTNVDSYLHWHHEGTRRLSQLIQPLLRPDLLLPTLVVPPEKLQEQVHSVLTQLDSAWLSSHDYFLAGSQQHSIADILCYGEVVQAVMMGALTLKDYANLSNWSRRMQQIEFHDDIHVALTVLGNVSDDGGGDESSSKGPISKRLGVATKEGLKAVEEAQKRYSTTDT
jgi:glutathione S-transferase